MSGVELRHFIKLTWERTGKVVYTDAASIRSFGLGKDGATFVEHFPTHADELASAEQIGTNVFLVRETPEEIYAMLEARGEQPSPDHQGWRAMDIDGVPQLEFPLCDTSKCDTIIVNGREFRACGAEKEVESAPVWTEWESGETWNFGVPGQIAIGRVGLIDDRFVAYGGRDKLDKTIFAVLGKFDTIDEAKQAVIAAVGGGAK